MRIVDAHQQRDVTLRLSQMQAVSALDRLVIVGQDRKIDAYRRFVSTPTLRR